MAQTFLFIGEDEYQLSDAIATWVTSFAAKYGTDSIVRLNRENDDVRSVVNELRGAGLFASPKLCVIEHIGESNARLNIPADRAQPLQDQCMAQWDQMAAEHFVIIALRKPDKRTKRRKFLSKTITNQKSYDPLTGKTALSRAKTKLGDHASYAQLLVDRVGYDSGLIANEADKITAYLAIHPDASADDVARVVTAMREQSAFAVMDHVLAGDSTAALTALDGLRTQGTNAFEVHGGMMYTLRLIVSVLDTLDQPQTKLKAPPFVIKKIRSSSMVTRDRVGYRCRLLTSMVDLEFRIKSGLVTDQARWLSVKQFLS